MQRLATHLLLVAACAACAPCLAQEARATRVTDGAAPASAAEDGAQRSPFGRVMAVMIASLQHQASASQHSASPVRTSANGTPLGIEVGDAFRTALDTAATAPVQATGSGGVA